MTSSISAGAPDRLPNAEEPFPDESLPGFLKRMAEANGFDGLKRFLAMLQPDFTTFPQAALRAAGDLDLAAFLALTPEELDRLCYGDGPLRRILGRELSRDLVAIGERKACPLCLDEAPYHRATWDLVPISVCPVHAVRLVDRCTCGARLGWGSRPLLRCSDMGCADDVRDIPAFSVPDKEMGGVRAVDALLRHGDCDGLDAGQVADLSVGERIFLIFRLGVFALGYERSTRPPVFARQHGDQFHRVLDAGWRICADWPRGFHALLEERRAAAEGRGGRFGVQRAFGSMHRRVEALGDSPHARLMARAIADYVVGCPELATRAPEIRRARTSADPQHRHATVREAMQLLGVGFDRVRELGEERALWIVPPTGKGAPALLRADGLHELYRERSAHLSKRDVCRELGIAKRTVERLREAGFLPTVPDPDEPDFLAYPREGIEALIRKLEASVPDGKRATPRPAVTIAGVARRVYLPGFDTFDVIRAVLEGRLAPVALSRRAKGLGRFLFREADVDRLAAEIRAQECETMSVVEAAAELGVKQEVAYHWVRVELLGTVAGAKVTEAGRRVTAEALRRFREEYATGTEVARRLGLAVRWASVHLRERGVRPVSGPGVDGARQYLFRRAEALSLPRTALVSGATDRHGVVSARKRFDRRTSTGFRNGLAGAVTRALGLPMRARNAVLQDVEGRVVVRLMVAGNTGVVGTYRFTFHAHYAADLEAAAEAWVALGLAEREDFLLVPWAAFRDHLLTGGSLPDSGTRAVVIRAAPDGSVAPFGEHLRPRSPPP